MNNEKQMQAKIVTWFGQNYPKHRGLLFEVNNDTTHGASRMAMGMVPGVSDLALISPEYGIFCGIEFKFKGKRHPKEHIKKQFKWGSKVIENGGYYIMASDYDLIKQFIMAIMRGDFDNAEMIENTCMQVIAEKLENKAKSVGF